MKAASSVSPKGAELGRFRKIRKKDIMWIRNPNNTIGSRPHRIVFVPRIPNKAPPVIKIIRITSRKTIQVLWDYRLPLWCGWSLHSFGMLHDVGYWHFGTTYRFHIKGSSSTFFVGCLTLQEKGITFLGNVRNHLTSDVASHILQELNPWYVNPLNAELNPICCLLALLGAHHFLHVSRIRVKIINP